ncbi:unnamed protein product [Dicrocoelium dendriticum]|nr:unnamed protein product [Dicrocoelium dendriticum]
MLPRRREWSKDVASRLFAQANQFLPECASKVEVYRRHAAQFPGWSVEGIKKQLEKMRWPRWWPSSDALLWDSPAVLRVPPVLLPEVSADLTESDLVPDGMTNNRDPDQNEAPLEPNIMQFSYEEHTAHSWRVCGMILT